MLSRLWRDLPFDGLGWAVGGDPVLAALRIAAAADWRRRRPLALRPLILLADRAGWPAAALRRSLVFARAAGLRPSEALAVFGDCLLSGALPVEARIWRGHFGGRHPLPGRSASLVLGGLGDAAGHALLADKRATALRLAAVGATVPALRRLHPRGAPVDPADLAAAADGPGLFVKPRHGHGGRDCLAVARQGTAWTLDGRPVDPARLGERLTAAARRDDLLAEDRQVAAAALSDLAAGPRAPVLRLATARRPGAAPFLQSALLSVPRPGADPRHFLDGALHAPVDPATGRLAAGLSLAEPGRRLERTDWNGAPLAGRPLPDLPAAVAMVVAAMAALPPLPLVHWDLVLTGAGPVVLEGNTAGNWILACLPGLLGLDAGPLAPLLLAWHDAAVSGSRAS